MGYFSNGTEGMMYEEEFCARCKHGQDEMETCAVWEAHFIYNYDEANNEQSILHWLIPREADGSNGQCRMFLPLPEE